MKKCSLIHGLVVLMLAAGAAEAWSQECLVSCHRPGALMHLFQQRLCGALCGCDCTSPTQIQKGSVCQKDAPLTKTVTFQKAIPVQKAPHVQKSGCRREVSDTTLDCEPCGFSRPRLGDLFSRWNDAIPRLFPPLVPVSPCKEVKGKADVTIKDLPRSRKGCGCEPDLLTDLSEPIPMIEKPQIDKNPFQDDALQPAPLPGAPTREARNLPRLHINDPSDSTSQQPVVRHASYYLLSVEVD
jgi:hypothetical protein